LRYLQDALSRVGDNALIYAAMGYVYWQYVNAGFRQQEYAERAEEYANKSIALDPDSSQSHFLLGVIHQALKGDPARGVHHLKRAIVADPNNADALAWLMLTYAQVGRPGAARPLIERLLQVDPLTTTIRGMSGWLALMEGRYEEALKTIRTRYETEPISVHGIAYALALVYNGQVSEAVSMTDHVLRTTPKNFYDRLLLFLLYCLQGKKSDALECVTEEVKGTARRDPEYSWEIAIGYAMIGEADQAFDWLDNAVDRGFINYPFLSEHDRFLDSMREQDRFKHLMARVKREWESFAP
jgi:tetratricopeptide (TPR) repeat protein